MKAMKVVWTVVDTGVATVFSLISLPFWVVLATVLFAYLSFAWWVVALGGAVLSGIGVTLLERWWRQHPV